MNNSLIKNFILTLTSMFIVACSTNTELEILERVTMNGITIPKGFEIEKLYSPGAHDQGSWVSITKDDQGHLFTSDQFGNIYKVILPSVESKQDSVIVKKIELELGMAQGLLWHENILYALVNAQPDNKLNIHSGFYKITDANNDNTFDTVNLLRSFDGNGEHGPHNITLGPDGKSLYLVLGNHTDIPDDINSTMPKNWEEDNLLPVIKDPSGHANDRKAPGGWVVKTDFEGENWTILNVGLRNTYDIAFNPDGELFAFDSDMEYDMGMPWYRPIRLCHLTSGTDYGWRTGTGKFAPEYPDNLPGIANLGQGSPTGLLEGNGLKFPIYYQKGLYLFDWSYGTMYFASLTPKGSSYTAHVTEFLSGVPLPLTNGIVGNDGAMYFLTGGRQLESALYKVTYTGKRAHDVQELTENNSEINKRQFRKKIEKFQLVKSTDKIDFLIENLNHKDRYIRYAARVALENQDINIWKLKIAKEENTLRVINLAIAIAHQGQDIDRIRTLKRLLEIDWKTLSMAEKTDFLRAVELLIIRTDEKLNVPLSKMLKDKLLPFYLKESPIVNKQLCALFSYLDEPKILEPTIYKMEHDTLTTNLKTNYLSGDISKRSDQYGKDVENMLRNMPNQQNISYAKSLSEIKTGWTKALRERYFRWYNKALKKSGGKQYANFIKAIQRKALEKVAEEDRDYYAALSSESMYQQMDAMKNVKMPVGPGKDYTAVDIENIFTTNKSNVNFNNGENFFKAALCISCHSIKGIGGSSGPELTQIGNRFSVKDLAESIVKPSKTISDRYRNTIYHLKNGNSISGRLIDETEDELEISINAFSPDITSKIRKDNVIKTEISSQSAMPSGLVSNLNEKELSDLIAYLIAGGDKAHDIYK